MSHTAFELFGPDPGTLRYRVHRLDAAGGVEGTEFIDAPDDATAQALAARMANGHGIDLWERGRFLASFPALRATAPNAVA